MRNSIFAIAITAIAVVAACHTNPATGVQHMCKTDLSGITSPAPGVISLMGKFYSDESVIVHAGTVLVGTGTPATDRTSFSFSNVPSGTQSIDVIVSCDGGQDHLGYTTVVVR